jgi:hypothetical protein
MGRNAHSQPATFSDRLYPPYQRNFPHVFGVVKATTLEEDPMGLGRGLLLWMIGIPLPIIILIALFMHH